MRNQIVTSEVRKLFWFRVQFGINQHNYIIQRQTKFVVFEKFASADLS